ncbi:MAG: ABC transporter substrate-binding protein, partial [Dehalococcoidia bacterium]
GGTSKVNIGVTPILSGGPLLLAYDKGYFREQGLDLNLVQITGGTDMVAETATGHFDVGNGGIGAGIFNAFARGIKLRVVAPVTVFNPPVATPLLGSAQMRQKGEVNTIADLRGRKVSIISKGASSEFLLDSGLKRGGLTLADVSVEVIAGAEAVAALANGVIAGGAITEPSASEAIGKDIAFVLSDDYVSNFMVIAMYLNESFAATRREDAIGVVAALFKGGNDFNAPFTDQNVEILSRYTKVPPDTIRAARRPFADTSGDVHQRNMEEQQRFSVANGDTTYKDPVDLSEYVDSSIAQAALRRLGVASAPSRGLLEVAA